MSSLFQVCPSLTFSTAESGLISNRLDPRLVLRVAGMTTPSIQARSRFLAPILEHLNHAGLGHISEIADAEKPHTPRGCPFQAWSLAELLRLERSVLG
jgi:Amylo-alpha-1,6-glucosidase